MSLVSAHAPMAKAPTGIKAKFVDDLQNILNFLPTDYIVMVLHDFNAQIGKREMKNGVWKETRGLHGNGACNKAGEQLLKLCANNTLTIVNIWFKRI